METIIFNLANNIDIIETNKLIEQYKKDNKEQIVKCRNRKPDTILELEDIIAREQHRTELRRVENITTAKEEKIRKLKNHEALIDDLMFLESDAKSIVEQHKATAAAQENVAPVSLADLAPAPPPAPTQFTSGIGFSSGLIGSKTFLPVPKHEEVALYVYQPFHIVIGGPEPPSLEELKFIHQQKFNQPSPFLQHIRPADKAEVAGGYHHSLACRRALQDAFMDIAMQPEILFAPKSMEQELELQEQEIEQEEAEGFMDTS